MTVLKQIGSLPVDRVSFIGLRPLLIWTPIFLLLTAAFAIPAIWNGYPLIFPDTGGYLARPFEGRLEMGRSAFYGALLYAGLPFNFYPVVIVQSASVAWLLVQTMRLTGVGQRPGMALAIGIALAVTTGLPWYAAQLMPDIFTGIAVLSFYLLAFQAERLNVSGRCLAAVLAAASLATHMSILGLALGLLAALVILSLLAPRLNLPRPNLRWPAAAVIAGLLTASAANYAIARQFGFTPGGGNFLFARMVEDGIAAQYLADHCPDATLHVCEVRDSLPLRGEDWLWDNDSPLRRPGGLGGWAAFEPEADRIFRDSLIEYPLMHVRSALAAAARQFVMFATGDGLNEQMWHAQWILETYAPSALPGFLAAKQRAQDFDFSALNVVHIAVALASVAVLPFIAFGRTRRTPRKIAALALLVLLALVGNAVICGIFSIPGNRYQGRLVWLATFTVMLTAAAWRRHTEPPFVI